MVEVRVTREFFAWWEGLTIAQQEHVTARVELLEEFGPMLWRPPVEPVTGSAFQNMEELRAAPTVPCVSCWPLALQGGPSLLVGGDDGGDWSGWYRRVIPEADRLYRKYLEETEGKGTAR